MFVKDSLLLEIPPSFKVIYFYPIILFLCYVVRPSLETNILSEKSVFSPLNSDPFHFHGVEKQSTESLYFETVLL